VSTINIFGLIACLLLISAASAEVQIQHPATDNLTGAVGEVIAQAREQFDGSQKTATDYAQLGSIYHAHEFEQAAGQAYQNAVALSPMDARWHHLAGIIAHSTGRFADAIASLRSAADLNPDYGPSRIRLAEAYLEAGQLDQANEALEGLLESSPDVAIVQSSLGRVKSLNGDHQAALAYYLRAQELQPDATLLNYHIAQAYRQVGDVEKAREVLTMQGARPVYYADPIHDRVRRQSRSSAYYMSLAQKAAAARDFEISLQLLGQAAALDPDNPKVSVHQARMLDALEQREQAILMLDQIIEKHPDLTEALMERGSLAELSKDDIDAAGYYQRAVTSQDESFVAHQFLANSLMRQLDYQNAARHYQRALELKPERVELAYRKAAAEYESGNCVKATATLLDLVTELQTDFEALMMYVRVVATCPSMHAEHMGQAANAALNMYRLEPTVQVITTLAMIQAARGQFEDAASYQAQAIFEAVKMGDSQTQEDLKRMLIDYEQNQPAQRPWTPVNPVLFPRFMTRDDKY